LIKVVIFFAVGFIKRGVQNAARTAEGEVGGEIVPRRIILAREFGVDKSFQGAALKCERS
jgi:hypothetical protein